MRKILIILALLMPSMALAQQAPDNEAILRAIVDNNSPYYYPSIFGRYLKGDLTLTAGDYHHLYYGYPYHDNYRPLEATPREADEIMMIFGSNPEPDSIDCVRILQLAKEVMKTEPFDPRNINFMTYAYGVLGDAEGERISNDRFVSIMATIKSTGTGIKENSPWHVLRFSHATDLLATMNLKPLKRLVVTRTVEYISLVERDNGIKGYYFDFGRVYWKRPETEREKRVQGLEINGIKPKAKKNYQGVYVNMP